MSASHLHIPKEPIMLARLPTQWSILAFVRILAAGTIRLNDEGEGSARWMMTRARKRTAVAGTRYDVMKQRGEPWAKLSRGRGVAGSKNGKQTLAPGTNTYVSNMSRDCPASPSGNIPRHLLWQPRLHICPENTSLHRFCMYA